MKKVICLILVVFVLFSPCGCNSTTNEFVPKDLSCLHISELKDFRYNDVSEEFSQVYSSYSHVSELENFKCNISYNGQDIKTLYDDEAKRIYKLIAGSSAEEVIKQGLPEVDCISILFYKSNSVYNSTEDNAIQYYGYIRVYSNGLSSFTGSPYTSRISYYQVDADLFNSINSLVYP